jgi:agmatinase
MSGAPAFAALSTFLATRNVDCTAPFCIAGVPLDLGTTNRPGARFGPAAIRAASRMLIDGCHPTLHVDTARLPIADIGNFEIALGDISQSYDLIERQALAPAHLVTLGGDHGVTLPLLRALAKKRGPLGLVHFDAHVDTWPENAGQRYAHGSVFYHAIEEGLVDSSRMIQIGIRSPVEREVVAWTLGKGVTIVSAQDVHAQGAHMVARRILEVVGAGETYLSFDIDALDPAFAPGTGTPEIGGLATWQAQAILRAIGDIDFVGMDVMEVAPAYDVSEITALAAATLVWEYLCLAHHRAGRLSGAQAGASLRR